MPDWILEIEKTARTVCYVIPVMWREKKKCGDMMGKTLKCMDLTRANISHKTQD